MENTTSTGASSATRPTILPPAFASGSALARVRFQIETSRPTANRRSAIGKPMRPMPFQPIFCLFIAMSNSSVACRDSCNISCLGQIPKSLARGKPDAGQDQQEPDGVIGHQPLAEEHGREQRAIERDEMQKRSRA